MKVGSVPAPISRLNWDCCKVGSGVLSTQTQHAWGCLVGLLHPKVKRMLSTRQEVGHYYLSQLSSPFGSRALPTPEGLT